MNYLSVPMSILSYVTQNTVALIHITNIKIEKIMQKKRNCYLFMGITIHALITKPNVLIIDMVSS